MNQPKSSTSDSKRVTLRHGSFRRQHQGLLALKTTARTTTSCCLGHELPEIAGIQGVSTLSSLNASEEA